METEKTIFNLPAGVDNVEITLREAPAAKVLDEKAPVKINISGIIHHQHPRPERRPAGIHRSGDFRKDFRA